MTREIITVLGPHRVYGSVKSVLNNIAERRGMATKDISPGSPGAISLYTGRKTIWHTPTNPSRENLYVTNSPLFSLEAWEILAKGVPLMVYEEYFPRGRRKDSISKMLLKPFKNIPFICPTMRTHEFLLQTGIMSFAIPPATRRIKQSRRREHILFIGRAEETKNPMFFFRLARLLKDEHFVFIGRGALSQKLRAEAKGIRNLEYLDFVEKDEELTKYYSKAKLFVHTATSDPIAFVIVEALSASVPVITSPGVGASDFLPENWVIKDFLESSWARKIREITENQDASIELARQAYESNHLDIGDPYFKKIEGELELAISEQLGC